ncbi:zf-HC2 domain-containing protein [Arthrobacter sp. NA-172]|uniref:zf-HC2 domain-containing protein n=1 Tax=Arthrobacter sp. NA-172 TaxID=3367524 RepID=UPI0037546D0C
MRAREGLRRQYLQMHVKETPEDDCTEFVSQLGSYVRGGLSKTAEAKVRDHLDSCAKCTAILLELNDVQGAMRAVLLPLITGVPLAAWAGRASGLGVVGQIPGTSTTSGFAGISPAVLMPLTVAIGLGLVAGTIGLAVALSGAPDPGAYHAIVTQSTQPALPSSVPATHAPPATTATTPAPLPVPAGPTAHATPATQKPPVAAQALTPQPVPSPVPHTPAAPLPSPTPTPTPAPTLAQVSGTASRTDSGTDPTTATVEVIFTLSRTDGPGTTTADFSIDNNAWIDGTSVSAPAGWNCTAKPADPANLSCITNSAQAGDLKFSLKLNTSHTWEETTFTYALSGPRIAANSFHLRL